MENIDLEDVDDQKKIIRLLKYENIDSIIFEWLMNDVKQYTYYKIL